MNRYLSDTRVSQLCDMGILRRDGDAIPAEVGVYELLEVLPVHLMSKSGEQGRLIMAHTGLGWSAGYRVQRGMGFGYLASVPNAPELVDALYLLILSCVEHEYL